MVRPRPDMLEISTSTSASSSSSSPERTTYDEDTDFFTAQRNDSESSIGVSSLRDMTMSPSREREHRISPISRLPPELLIGVFTKLSSSMDLRSCMLVSKTWSRNSVDLLWHRPLCNTWPNLESVVKSIQAPSPYYSYNALVKRLNLSNLNDRINDGTVRPFMLCKRIERLTLTGCIQLTDQGVCSLIHGSRSLLALDITGLDSITDHTLRAVSENCGRLQGLNITDCSKVMDDSLVAVAEHCHFLKRVRCPSNPLTEIADKILAQAQQLLFGHRRFHHGCRTSLPLYARNRSAQLQTSHQYIHYRVDLERKTAPRVTCWTL